MKDILYGNLKLLPIVNEVIAVPEFITMADKKQLGCHCYVNPAASHTRYEHSIGVACLAQHLVMSLREHHPEQNITDKEVKCVVLAGLFHDIGHGPLSHFFDMWLINRGVSKPHCEHEYRSKIVLRYLVYKYKWDISDDEIEIIGNMIDPSDIKNNNRQYLYQIVANKDFNLDVDKIDYLYRDSKVLRNGYEKFVGVFDIIENIRIKHNNLVVHQNNQMDILNLFTLRYMFHRDYYVSSKTRAVDCIMNDIYNILQTETDIDMLITDENLVTVITTMSDSIIESRILDYEKTAALYARILSKKWWKCIYEYRNMDIGQLNYKLLQKRLSELNADYPNYVIDCHKIGLVSGSDKNPLKSIQFYNPKDGSLKQQDNFVLFHDNYQEIVIYCFRRVSVKSVHQENMLKENIAKIIQSELQHCRTIAPLSDFKTICNWER